MAISFVGAGTAATGTGDSVTLSYPAGIAANDVAIVHLARKSIGIAWGALPSGYSWVWNPTNSDNNAVCYKVLSRTETSDVFQIMASSSTTYCGQITVYRGCNTAAPIGAVIPTNIYSGSFNSPTTTVGPIPGLSVAPGQQAIYIAVTDSTWTSAAFGAAQQLTWSTAVNVSNASGPTITALHGLAGTAFNPNHLSQKTFNLTGSSGTGTARLSAFLLSPDGVKDVFINTAGSGSDTPPSGVISAMIDVVGGGGGTMSGTAQAAAGGSAGFSRTNSVSISAGQTVYYTVGAGGAANSATRSDGSPSWVNVGTNSPPTSKTTGALANGGGGASARGTGGAISSTTGAIGDTTMPGIGGNNAQSGGGARGGTGGTTAGGPLGQGSSGQAGSGTAGGAAGNLVDATPTWASLGAPGGQSANPFSMAGAGGAGGGSSSGAGGPGGIGYVRIIYTFATGNAGFADGSSTVSGVLTATTETTAAATGQGAASAAGRGLIQTVGSAAGASTVSAVGNAAKPAVGTAAGVSSIAGTGVPLAVGVGSTAGAGAATGASASRASATATATGQGTVSAVGAPISRSTGTSLGQGVASAVGRSNNQISGVGSAVGSATAAGVAVALFKGMGSAAGQATVLGRAPKVAPTGLVPISPAGVLAYLWFDFKNGVFWVNGQFLNPEDLFSKCDQIQASVGWVQAAANPGAQIVNSDVVNFLTGVNWAVRIRASAAGPDYSLPVFLYVGDNGDDDYDVILEANLTSVKPSISWGAQIEENWWNGLEYRWRTNAQDFVDSGVNPYPAWATFDVNTVHTFAFYRADATAFIAADGELTDILLSAKGSATPPSFAPGTLTTAWLGTYGGYYGDTEPARTVLTIENLAAWYPPANSADTIVIAQEPITMVDPSSTGATVGTSTGVGVAAGVGAAKASAIGAAAGSSAAIGVAAGQVSMVGSAAGSATASGVSAFKSAATGTAAGLGVVVGAGASLTRAAGSAAGAATASAALGVLLKATGSAAGAATASGASRAGRLAAGSAAGAATVSGVIRPGAIMTGVASGQGSALGVLRATALIVGAGPGKADAFGDLAFLGWAQPAPHVQSWAQPAADVAVWTDAPPVSGDWS